MSTIIYLAAVFFTLTSYSPKGFRSVSQYGMYRLHSVMRWMFERIYP